MEPPEEPNEEASQFLEESADEVNRLVDEYHNDQPNEMTRGRRIARYLGNRHEWYDPSRKKEGNLKLDESWAHFEHSALPRHFIKDNDSNVRGNFLARLNDKDKLVKAEHGERDVKTQLYNVFTTPERDLGDFGLGIGIYFWTLKMLVAICFVAGCISIPNILYFESDEYDSSDRDSSDRSLINFALQGSAVCRDTEWVLCPDCEGKSWDSLSKGLFRYANTTDGLFFVLRNNCQINYEQGIYAFATLTFAVLSIIIMNLVSRRREVQLDESQQTVTDYSVQISDPPPDAFDPEEWKSFFSQKFGNDNVAEVVAVTIALDNEKLIRTLVERRRAIQNIKALLKPGIQLDHTILEEMLDQSRVDSSVSTWKEYLLSESSESPARKHLKKVRRLEEKARQLAQKKQVVSHVFVTFQTEEAQRAVLKALTRSGFEDMFASKSSEKHGYRFRTDYRFRGVHMLYVTEPKEPSTILWHNLDNTTFLLILQVISAFLFVLAAIAGGSYIIVYASKLSPIMATIAITAINQVIPLICKFLSNHESHKSRGALEASLYMKMTIFKWINTAVIIRLITPSISTIDSGLESVPRRVYTIFFAELITNPVLLLMDIWGQLQRHYLGPRENSQEKMNLRFGGATFSLALRYTEITKILFLTFFYSSTYPGGFFFAAVSLITNYFVDKFCLLRSYGGIPEFGNSIAQLSRSYIFPAAFAAYSIMLSYDYSGFPYDNLCADEEVLAKYVGNHTIYVKGENTMPVEVAINENDNMFKYCDQDMVSLNYAAFPAIPANQLGEGWMDDEQERAATLLGWTSVVVCGIAAVAFLRKFYFQTIHNFFTKTYKPIGKASDQRFTDPSEHYGYIPSVSSSGFQYPLLACDISDVDEAFLDWSDPSSTYPYDKHNLIHDMPNLSEEQRIFSIIKTWSTMGDITNPTCAADTEIKRDGSIEISLSQKK